jgi:transcriptional regulator with XRE-family HTH domain
VATVERVRDRGSRQVRRISLELGQELRDARLGAGLSQHHIAEVAGLAQSRISRTERGELPTPRLEELTAHSAVLGLCLSLKLYPEGLPLRDAAQLSLLARLRAIVHHGFEWHSEVPVGGPHDLRAWDAILTGPARIAIDAETRLRDMQALQRREELKWRDSGVDRLVLLVSATHHNRAVLREFRSALASTFPLDSRETLAALRAGRAPAKNGIILL